MDSKNLKEQRDRFLAFSFASADLFLEISETGEIVYALGAAKGLTGIDSAALLKKSWFDLFDKKHHKTLLDARDNALPGLRAGPFTMTLDAKLGKGAETLVSGIKMPNSVNFYLTIGFPNLLLSRIATQLTEFERTKTIPEDDTTHDQRTKTIAEDEAGEFERTKTIAEDDTTHNQRTKTIAEDEIGEFERTETIAEALIPEFERTQAVPDEIPDYTQTNTPPEDTELLDKDSFLDAAQDALNTARALGDDLDMTLLDIPQAPQIKDRLGNEIWEGFTETLTHLLASKSVDGQAVAEIKEGRYAVIHDKNITSDALLSEIDALSKESDPEGEGFEIEGKTVSSDLSSLSDRETTKALIYTINEFERKGTSMTIDTLNSDFKTYVSANAQKIQQFKFMVEQLNFDLHFQPLVDLTSHELSHYEILSRFKGETSTQEWVIFGEDIGMAADFDIAVCERAINYLLYKAAGSRVKYAVNLSGQSMQNEQFFKTLMAKLTLHKDLAKRLIFEITESTTIENLEMVNHFIHHMQKKGYQVCLDDFGAGAASFQYLHKLDVDYIKLDGQYTRKLLTSDRDRVMVKNLSQMCKDLDVTLIVEKIEQEEQMKLLQDMNVPLGQGYLFGKSGPWPDYNSSNLNF